MVALAALSKVPIGVADRLMASERPDPVLILCKAAEHELVDGEVHHRGASGWQGGVKPRALDSAFANYGRLSASTAQRVVRFWQVRPNRSAQILAENQKTRGAVFARRLGVVTRRDKTRPGIAPIVGRLRRPFESTRARKRCSVQAA